MGVIEIAMTKYGCSVFTVYYILAIKTFSVQSLFWIAIAKFNIIDSGNDKYILRGWLCSFIIIIIIVFSIIMKLFYSFIIVDYIMIIVLQQAVYSSYNKRRKAKPLD